MLDKIEALLLDHDGTLVNSEPAQFEIWQEILAEYQVEYTFEDFIPRIGIPGNLTAEHLVERYQLPVAAAELAQIKEQQTDSYLQQKAFPLMPGISDIIDWAKVQQIKLAVVSGAERPSVMRSLQHHSLLSKVDCIVAGGDTSKNKPDPMPYLAALEHLQVSARCAVALEDSAGGIESATGANVTCVAIQHSFTPIAKLTKANKIFASHSDILAWLKSV
ncbi:HAD-superfamily hydrolase [Catenovulum agarivorans DS-2]|uniref:HAD-superfamily hydrolase n=1 Tax=Catenovulum agarivorans DS-2 TaxID=1328313 RepID=W7QT23_9ALTE|nr:HAD family phosphatase [Catenovulum agarivorans]EWH12157.1 HAD-superfamily hydrolase [Catenovulum agarivorans DS-2]